MSNPYQEISTTNYIDQDPTGTGYGVDFSHDSTYMAVAHNVTPFITIYKRNGDVFTKLPDPETLPASTVEGVSFSHDSTYMAVAHWATPFVTIYKRNGDVFTKLPNPEALPPDNGIGVAFSHDSLYMTVVHRTTPFVIIYKYDGVPIIIMILTAFQENDDINLTWIYE